MLWAFVEWALTAGAEHVGGLVVSTNLCRTATQQRHNMQSIAMNWA